MNPTYAEMAHRRIEAGGFSCVAAHVVDFLAPGEAQAAWRLNRPTYSPTYSPITMGRLTG